MLRLQRGCIAVVALMVAASVHAADPAAPAKSDPAKRVLLVTIDGLRPDVALRANMPNLRGLMDKGVFTFWAQTTKVAVTLPSHATLLTGVSPEKHGVTWNNDLTIDQLPNWPKVPTLFELAKAAGYTTGMVSGKVKFCVFQKPGALDWSEAPTKGKLSDEQTAEAASRMLREHQPAVMLVHFTGCDTVGHAKGWGSPDQVRAAESADVGLGQVLKTLDDLKVRDRTLIILTADHGGAVATHGGADPRSQHIPWIMAGPGFRANHDLTLEKGLTVKIEDSLPTALEYLGIPVPDHCEGKTIPHALVPAAN
jgi:predicted AlkP superfamily pyrophosphatase or phosphodiesterase